MNGVTPKIEIVTDSECIRVSTRSISCLFPDNFATTSQTNYNSIIVFGSFFSFQLFNPNNFNGFHVTISLCVYLEFIVLHYSDTLMRVENEMKGSSTNQLQTGIYKHTAAQRTLNVLRPMRLWIENKQYAHRLVFFPLLCGSASIVFHRSFHSVVSFRLVVSIAPMYS